MTQKPRGDRPASCPSCKAADKILSNGTRGPARRWFCGVCGHNFTTWGPGEGPAPEVKGTKAPERVVSDEVSENARTIVTRSADITTLEQLLAYSQVDLAVWEVERHTVNSWEVTVGPHGGASAKTFTNYQVKAWLRRKRQESLQDVLAAFREDAGRHAPKYRPIKRRGPESGNLLEISVPDLHFGLLAWGRETGGADYDIKIAEAVFLDAVQTLAQSARPYGFQRILLPIGNDFFHVNNAAGTTAAGTSQDTDSRWQKSFTAGRRVVVAAADQLRELAPVDIVIVPGNHDPERSYYLGEVLAAWYRNCADVQVDNAPLHRKYIRHGRCLVGFTHGSGARVEQLPLLMAQEVPELWAATEYREVHIGHLHHSQVKAYQQETEHAGVRVVTIPSLAAPSAWTANSGYHALREACSFIWNEKRGRVATLHYHPEAKAAERG